MYNADIKQRFIDVKREDVVMPKYFMDNLFSHSELFELRLTKDINSFNKEEILQFYKFLNYSSLQSYRNTNTVLKHYTQWCFNEGLLDDGQNHYDFITTEDLASCINTRYKDKMILSQEDINQLISMLYNPRDQFTVLSLFEFGTTKQYLDIVNIKRSDIDEDSRLLHLDNRNVSVSSKWISIAYETDDTLDYYLYNDGYHKVLKLEPSIYIYKESTRVTVGADFRRAKRMGQNFRVLRDYLGLPQEIKLKNIITSGRIAMIKRRSRELNIDPIDYIKDYKDEIDNQFGNAFVWSEFVHAYKDYLY